MIFMHYFEPEINNWRSCNLKQLPSIIPADARLWINLNDATQEEQLSVLHYFSITSTLTDDFSRDRHPPKVEMDKDFTLLILRGYADSDFSQYNSSAEVKLLYSKNILISRIQCHNTQLLKQLQPQLIENESASIAKWIKSIIFSVSESYLSKLINFEDEQSYLEDAMLNRGNDEQMALMMRYRSVLRKINRNLAYQKEIFSEALYENESLFLEIFSKTEKRDFYERFERLHSMTQMYYDQLSDLVHSYMSTTSHQINERMKVLTMVSSIFIPLTFLAGIYGMNFANMPELTMPNAYFIVLIFMAIGGIAGLIWFKIRGWW